jgi:hypothetical protein
MSNENKEVFRKSQGLELMLIMIKYVHWTPRMWPCVTPCCKLTIGRRPVAAARRSQVEEVP